MKQLDCRYKEDENGFVPAECWNLDTTFAMYIYSHLCYFRDNCNVGHPGNMSEEKWNKILDDMIIAFKLLIEKDETDYHSIESKNRQKKIRYGLRTDKDYNRLKLIINNVALAMEQNIIYPNSSYHCSSCLAKGLCNSWGLNDSLKNL